jgi:hypothetical protein
MLFFRMWFERALHGRDGDIGSMTALICLLSVLFSCEENGADVSWQVCKDGGTARMKEFGIC